MNLISEDDGRLMESFGLGDPSIGGDGFCFDVIKHIADRPDGRSQSADLNLHLMGDNVKPCLRIRGCTRKVLPLPPDHEPGRKTQRKPSLKKKEIAKTRGRSGGKFISTGITWVTAGEAHRASEAGQGPVLADDEWDNFLVELASDEFWSS